MRCNAIGTQLIARLLPPSDNRDPVGYFLASVNDLFEYTLRDRRNSDMVGIIIQNQVKMTSPLESVLGGKTT